MNFLHEVINAIANQPSSTWTTLGAYLAGSTLVASLVQVLKHRLNIAEAKKLLIGLTGFVSFLVAFANLILQHSSSVGGLATIPWLGHVTALLLGGAVVVHRFAVGPAYYKFSAQLVKISNFLSEVQNLQAQKKTANQSAATPKPADQAQVPDEANLAQFQV